MQSAHDARLIFGLRPSDLEEIISNLESFPQIEEAKVFGSRAKGNYREGSDVDIALIGTQLNFDVVAKVHALLEEQSKMPYLFDVIDYTHLSHKDLREHIERAGIVFYKRKT